MRDDAAFGAQWVASGERLSRPPRGYAADHPAIDDLKWKDFVAVADLSRTDVLSADLVDLVAGRFSAARPFMEYLCTALAVAY